MYWAQILSAMQIGNYRAVSPWRPWSAMLMLIVIIILASAISVSVVNILWGVETSPPATGTIDAGNTAAGELSRRGLLVVLLMQLAMVGLTWIAASVGGGAGLGSGSGSNQQSGSGSAAAAGAGTGTGPQASNAMERAKDALALRHVGIGPRLYLAAIVVMFIWLAAYNALVWLIAYDQWQADLLKYNAVIFSENWWIFALVVVVGAPLSEEILFRGFLLPALARSQLGFMGAAFVSSMAWAALHWDYSTSGLIEIFLIGVYFSGLLWITGSLWVGIICHGAYNMVLLILLRGFSSGG